MAYDQPLFFEDYSKTATSPYFSLAHVDNLISTESLGLPKENKSVKEVWGLASRMGDDEQTRFLLGLMKHAELKVESRAIEAFAREWNIEPPYTVQQRFKAIVKRHGFDLENGTKVIGGPGTQSAAAIPAATTTPMTAPKRKRTSKTNGDETTAKKRKVPISPINVEDEEDETEAEDVDTPTKPMSKAAMKKLAREKDQGATRDSA